VDSSCNNVDNDCDGRIDEHYTSVQTTCGIGACERNGNTSCLNGSVTDSCTEGNPSNEVLNNSVDDDCDGTVDEGNSIVLSAIHLSDTGIPGQSTCNDVNTGATENRVYIEYNTSVFTLVNNKNLISANSTSFEQLVISPSANTSFHPNSVSFLVPSISNGSHTGSYMISAFSTKDAANHKALLVVTEDLGQLFVSITHCGTGPGGGGGLNGPN
jgi:hypothetical protein